MILCIDSGNSRIKWGLHDGQGWQASGAAAQITDPAGEIGALQGLTVQAEPRRIMLSNVASPAAGAAIRKTLAPWAERLHEVHSSAAAGGVSNGYAEPTRLGVDRWCALIGARALCPDQACLVVMAGTATTIDTLEASGHFAGGLIVPGFDLMRRALARDTAALPLAEGGHTPTPRSTDDAITSGCLEALAGAIERAYARLPRPAVCLLSGGNGDRLAPLLGIPCRPVDNLVLEGLRRLADA